MATAPLHVVFSRLLPLVGVLALGCGGAAVPSQPLGIVELKKVNDAPTDCGAAAPRKSRAEELDRVRQTLVRALSAAGAFEPGRRVSHVSHVCSLRIRGRSYPVVELAELVRGAMVPRGVGAILVLDSTLAVVQRIEFVTESPSFCVDNRLYVSGDLRIDGVASEGNELTFEDAASPPVLRHVEANEVPAPRPGSDPIQ